jgi:hypothetical protein
MRLSCRVLLLALVLTVVASGQTWSQLCAESSGVSLFGPIPADQTCGGLYYGTINMSNWTQGVYSCPVAGNSPNSPVLEPRYTSASAISTAVCVLGMWTAGSNGWIDCSTNGPSGTYCRFAYVWNHYLFLNVPMVGNRVDYGTYTCTPACMAQRTCP